MTIKDFAARYSLHDSTITRIEFDAANKILALTIEACWWLPTYSKQGEMISSVIRATFLDVSRFEYDDCIADRIFDAEINSEVRTSKIDANGNFIVFAVDFHPKREDIYYQLTICAETVEVKELAELERHTFND